MCSSDMKKCTVILETDLEKPRAMALDPTKGFMFFTKWGISPPTVDRALLDGTNRTPIVSAKIVYPQGVAIDLALQQVYWVDKYMDNIDRVDYYGNNRWTVKKSSPFMISMKSLHSINIFENLIYFSSWRNESIMSMNKFTFEVKIIASNMQHIDAISVFHRQKQPEVAHPCREKNGGCVIICAFRFGRIILRRQSVYARPAIN
jgi:low-density lipoprotein receptor-related protein 1 (alpha-2-macroglobulin receptor)